MHHSRDAQGRSGGGGSDHRGPRLRLVTDEPGPLPFPNAIVPGKDFPRVPLPDDVIADTEFHLDRTQRKLDELRNMLDPFPGRDDDDFPPRAA